MLLGQSYTIEVQFLDVFKRVISEAVNVTLSNANQSIVFPVYNFQDFVYASVFGKLVSETGENILGDVSLVMVCNSSSNNSNGTSNASLS